MDYQTIGSDMRSGHGFVGQSPSHFHPYVFHVYWIAE